MNQLDLHPIMVHFPIALLFTALAFDLVGLLWKKPSFFAAALYVQFLAALGAVASFLSGKQAEEPAERIANIEPLLEQHEDLGKVTMIAALAVVIVRLLLLRRGEPGSGTKVLFVLMSLGLAGLVGFTGFVGGRLVYEFGAGVQPIMHQLPPEREHHD